MSASFPEEAMTISHASSGREFNEFAHIEGLGPSMRRWLRESFHVHTIADLANLSAELVLSRLRDEEKDFCRREIERWIQQAQDFVAHQTPWRTFATFVVSLQSRQMGGQTEQRTTAYFLEANGRAIWSGIECNGVYELMLDQLKRNFQLELEVNVPMESQSSQPQAAAVNPSEPKPVSALAEVEPEPELELQPTRQAESAATKPSEPETVPATTAVEVAQPALKAVATVEPELEADESLEAATEDLLETEIAPKTEPEITEPLTLEITQLQLWQPYLEPVVLGRSDRSLPTMLHQKRPFELEVTFQITGKGASDLTGESHNYHIQCFLQNRENRKGVQLEIKSTGTLTNGELTYTKRLPEITSLKPGLYRLQVVTRLDGGYGNPDLFELPLVQVM